MSVDTKQAQEDLNTHVLEDYSKDTGLLEIDLDKENPDTLRGYYRQMVLLRHLLE